ncbi:MAG: C25 family cysteine peptidase [Bacteroidales bacterium]
MKKNLLFILFAILVLPGIVSAQSARVHEGNTAKIQISDNSQTGFTIRIDIPQPEFRTSQYFPDQYFELAVQGMYPSVLQGSPNLPIWNGIIEIPAGSSYEFDIDDVEMETMTVPEAFRGMQLVPVQPPRPKSDIQRQDFVKNEWTYNHNDWVGNPLVAIENDGIMRNARLGRLVISPVEYQPVAGEFRYVSSVTIRVRFQTIGISDPVSWKSAFESPFINASRYALNGESYESTHLQQPVKYVILSDSMFYSTLQPFIAWKRQKGFEVIEVYKGGPGVGTTATTMKSYLQSLYNAATPASPAPSFLLIVGDVQQIPAFGGTTGNHFTDLYYAEYTGDTYPELLYGRFSATSTGQLQPQIDKTLHVEQYLMSNPSYLEDVILVAGNDATYAMVWANGQMSYAQNEYVNTSNNLVPHTFLYPSSSSQTSQIIQLFNQGATLVNYSAHGSTSGWSDPSFTSTTAGTLTNTGKYPTVISNACLTNTFSANLCFGEALLRAQDKGAVGHIGGSANTFWDEDYHFAVGLGTVVLNPTFAQTGPGFYDRLFHTHGQNYAEWAVTQGAIINAGNMAVTQSGSSVDYYWEIYHLMGDPSLMPYLGLPSPMNPVFSPVLPTGLTQVTIQSDPYTYVALSANGILHGAGLTDGFGMLSLPIQPFTLPTTAQLVITGQNKIPYFDSIQFVTPTGPFVLADSISYQEITGNADQQIDAGEVIQMDVRIRNFTPITSGNLIVRLICNDPFITLTDSIENLAGINGLSTHQFSGAFAFEVATFVPDQHVVPATIQIQEGANVWTTPLSFTVNSPEVRIQSVVITDQAGNGNGKIEPGESFEFTVRVRNDGGAELQTLEVTLDHNSFYIQLNNNTATVPQFQPGQYYDVAFQAVASTASIPKGSVVRLTVSASKNSYGDTLVTYKMLELMHEDFEQGNFNTFPWVLTGSQPWFTTTDDPYEGATCAKSGAIPNQSVTSMQVEIPVIDRDSISFVYKVSSEENYDHLKFKIDGQEMGKWSGEQLTWTVVKFPVDSGLRTFAWSYEKDYYWQEGQDCAWIDYIIFPATSLYMAIDKPQLDAARITVWPNPASHQLNLRFDDAGGNGGILLLLGSDGKTLHTSNFQPGEHNLLIDLSGLSPGLYLLVVETDSGVTTKKVIKH